MGRYVEKVLMLLIFVTITTLSSNAQKTRVKNPLLIVDQGSFAIGGTVIQTPGKFDPIKQGAFNPAGPDPVGQTLHGDHAAVYYQIPAKANKLPLAFWHGTGQSSRCWQTTPDGRDGFQNIFLRGNYSIYLIDQPRRGNAGRATQPGTVAATPDEQLWFGLSRLGIYPDFYPNLQFPKDPHSLEQFYRQMVPNTAPFDVAISVSAVDALFDTLGQGILVTHSASGGLGWRTVLTNSNIKAVVAYEPGGDFVFPEGETPNPIVLASRTVTPASVPMADFKRLTKIPIVIYYGDNIPSTPSDNPAEEQWRLFLEMAKKWAAVINKHGGDATVVHLPEIGIKGNTHFPFSDLNNVQVADLLFNWLDKKGLNK
jgi:hypothetical protein